MLWYAALSHEGLVTGTYSMISLLLGLLRLDRHGIFLLVLCFLAASRTDATGGTADSTAYAHTANETDAFLQKLADARVLSGTVLVQKDGQLVYSNAFGWASEELGVPMKDSYIFPLGSNTKFFTAVAIYQLQEKGLLNVTDPVNSYIEPADFTGLGTLGWCPVIYGKEQLGCQEPSIKQLLAMTSGILPTDNMGCGTPNSTWTSNDWYWQYRLTTAELSWGEVVGATGSLFNGQQTMAQLLNAQGDLRRPLLFAPGEQYCYTNANFNIAAYIVEKLSNTSFTEYVTEKIIKPANLTNTYYWIGGQGMEPQGLRKNIVTIPGYLTTFRGSDGGGAPSEFMMVQRGSWWEGDLAYAAAAAGAMFGTAEDLLKWYNTFTAHPEVIGLSKEAFNNLTTPLQPIGVPSINASFAQGIAATGNKNVTDKILYTGGIWGFYTHIEMWLNHNDLSKSDAILYFTNLSPAIPAESNGTCVVRSTVDGSPVNLSSSACSGNMQDGNDLTPFVTESLARMWNISNTPTDSA